MTPFQALIILWELTALIAGAIIGNRKGRPMLGWGLAILLGWIGVIIIAVLPAAAVTRRPPASGHT